MNPNIKSNIAIVLSVAAILITSLGITSGPATPATPADYIKSVARETGISSRSYDQCIASADTEARVNEDLAEVDRIQEFAELPGIGTPYNLVITDTQVIPVSGAYPYEFFDLMITEINETGTVSEETLGQFEITPLDYTMTDFVRPFDATTDHYRGSETPTITIIEYSDLECPFCERIHGTLKQIIEENENVTWVYRHLPLDFHPQALPAALASECVAEKEGNDAFWNFADTIFANQESLK